MAEKKRASVPTEKFIMVDECMELLGVSQSKAYKVMAELNKELKSKGKIVISGRVSRKYFMERYC